MKAERVDLRRPHRHHTATPPGHCRWCGLAIDKLLHPRAQSWHPACVEAMRLEDPQHQRRLLRQRDGGRCAHCGVVTPNWQADHVVPLSDGGENHPRNLQTLCRPHHRAKTALEATARAERRRAQAEGQGQLL